MVPSLPQHTPISLPSLRSFVLKISTDPNQHATLPTMNPETHLLLLCCRHQAKTITTEQLTTFISTNKIPWHTIIPLALNHHLLPIVYKSLKKTDAPNDIIRNLRQLYMQIVAQNVQLTESLHKTTNKLTKANIPTLSIKGPVLASQAFGSISLRLFADLDLIVPQKQFLKAIDLLTKIGFHVECPSTKIDRKLYLKIQQEWILVDASHKIFLDIKPTLISHTISPLSLTKKLFAASNTVTNSEIRNIPAPNAEIMLLIVCIHGVHAKWAKLSQVMDTCGLIRSNDINWDSLLETAKEWGQTRSLLMGLALCSELIEIYLPKELRQIIKKEPKIQTLVQDTITELLSPKHNFDPSPKEKWRLERQTRDSFKDKITTGFRQTTTLSPKDIEWIPLPKPLFFLYPIVRLARLTVLPLVTQFRCRVDALMGTRAADKMPPSL